MRTLAWVRPRATPCSHGNPSELLTVAEPAVSSRDGEHLAVLCLRGMNWSRARRTLRRLGRGVRRLPWGGRALAVAAALALGTVAWQVAHKPTELLSAVAPTRPKPPARTWEEYRPLFEAHATAIVRPELLAALAQAESGGDPVATPPWRFRWSANPLDLYGPPSSAVGLMQMTDGNLMEARRLCIHDHEVARAGAWHDPGACWFNDLYMRIVPGQSIEMTSAWLDASVREIVAAQRIQRMTPQRERRLAAVVHLCGRARAGEYARRGFWLMPGERCGEHDVARYVERVESLARSFERMRSG